MSVNSNEVNKDKKQTKKKPTPKIEAVWASPPDLKKVAKALNQLYINTHKD